MENASKALLIAGAVLICILLIGVGVTIWTKTKGVPDAAGNVSENLVNKAQEKAGIIDTQLNSI